MLFLIPFALVGIGMSGWNVYSCVRWFQMRGWVETSATLVALELTIDRDEDGETYKVEGTYQYDWQGQIYVSEQIALFSGGDNIGSFQMDTYEQLQPSVLVPDGVTCFVNPVDPNDAVLIRAARWEMFTLVSLFASIFGSIGVLGLISLGSLRARERVRCARKEQFPDEPWKWNTRWLDGRVSSEQRDSLRNWTHASIWWLLCTAIPGFFSIRALGTGNFWAIFGLLLPALTVFILRGTLRRRRQLKLFGEAYVQLTDFPLRANLETTVAVVFSGGQMPTGPVRTRVSCECTFDRGGDTKTDVTFKDDQQIDLHDCRIIADGLCIAVPVSIPAQAKKTSTADGSIVWKLSVTVPATTRPMHVEFQLPVF